jgi:peptidyl-prolyl cis-trans isomerase B (cyclophilin B)
MRIAVVLAFLVPLLGETTVPAALSADERAIVSAEMRRTVDPAIVSMLGGQPSRAARAALALGRTKSLDARAPLRAHLLDSDTSVRAMVAYSLGLLEDATALSEAQLLARNDANSAVRYAAVDALGRIASKQQSLATHDLYETLIGISRNDSSEIVRWHAAAELEAFRAAPFADAVAIQLADAFDRERNPDVRWHIMWTIFRGYAARAPRETLARALTDSDETVRIEAVRAWGRRSDADAVALVEPLLADRSWRVQLQAGEALRQLNKQPPTEHLTALPPDLHLPPPERPNREIPLPRSSPAPARGAPSPVDVPSVVPLLPTTAEQMDGPLPGLHPRARIRTTKGDIVVRLYPEWAPLTVANFLRLADAGYYDHNRWFRIVPDFVVQTGDPNDNGEGDAGYTIPAEENPIEQRAGVLAMGLNYENGHAIRDSAGTQFYITISPQLHLDNDFTVFGEVESGWGTIARLIEADRILRVDRLPDR